MENLKSPVLDTPPQFVTYREAAAILRMGEVAFRKKSKDGQVPAGFKVSERKTLWSRAELIAFVASR
ncbi:MAG: helix-turn-helix transcriptional regulator [Propionivibrio sp.]